MWRPQQPHQHGPTPRPPDANLPSRPLDPERSENTEQQLDAILGSYRHHPPERGRLNLRLVTNLLSTLTRRGLLSM